MPLAGNEMLSFILTVGGWTSRWEEVDRLVGRCFVLEISRMITVRAKLRELITLSP